METVKRKKITFILFAMVLISAFLEIGFGYMGKTSPPAYNMIMGAAFACFALLHGITYNGKKAVIFLAVFTFIVTFIMEYYGVKTGLIFGEYHYGDVLGQKILDTVPFLVPFSWFMFMYVSTISVDAAFGGRYTGKAAPLIFAMLDCAAMIFLDVLIDPIWVTRGTWTWTAVHTLPAGSVFYGIPVQNYFGWLITTMIIFIPYRIIYFRNKTDIAERDNIFYLPCVTYTSIIICGCIDSWIILSNTGIIFVSLMTGGVLSFAALLGFITYRAEALPD